MRETEMGSATHKPVRWRAAFLDGGRGKIDGTELICCNPDCNPTVGETVGLSQDSIKELGVKVGEFLASNVDPENHEQRVLKELFEVGNKKEREVLTNMIIKMAQHDN